MTKQKKCKICKEPFTPMRQLQPTCTDIECMTAYANKFLNKKRIDKAKSRRKALKQFNDSDINLLKKKAQKLFNEFIRLRDRKEPCISCLYVGNGRQWHAGHYKPQGGNSLLRFNENNIHKQCSICNNHKSGNLVEYRNNLITKIGIEAVEELESMKTIKKWTKDELEVIILRFKHKIKELKNA